MNDIAKQATMEKLLHSIEVENLKNKAEIGRMLGINGTYLSMILNKNTWGKCPKSAWEAVLNWLNSGYTLNQYVQKYPASAEVKTVLVPNPIEINMPTDLQEKIKEADKQMDAILKKTIEPEPEKTAEQVIKEAVKTHPLAVEALHPKQEFTDTARLKIALDIEINLVVNGHKVSML